MTFNGAIAQTGDTVSVTQGVPYTFTISDSSNIIYVSITLRKTTDSAPRQEIACSNVHTCSTQYSFDDRDRQAQETRLEAVVNSGQASKDFYILCEVQVGMQQA